MKTGRWLSLSCGVVFLVSFTCAEQVLSSPDVATGVDGHPAQPTRANSLELLPLSDPLKPSELERAYLDSFSILKGENSCSEFYGGPAAIAALNQLTQQIRPTHLDRRIGIRMTGESTIVTSAISHFTFRFFDKAEVNLDGPFYRSNSPSALGRIPQIGPFEPNTREARVTSVLHELGHLVRGPNGQWVLPNDGDDLGQSQANTRRVLDVCGEQIKALRGVSFEEELLGAQSAAPPRAGVVDGTSE
jgi:hypothetical protein